MNVCGKEIIVQGRLVRIARLAHDRFEFLENPDAAIKYLREAGIGMTLFTFMKLPHVARIQLSDGVGQRGCLARVDVRTLVDSAGRRKDSEHGSTRREEGRCGCEVPFDDARKWDLEIYNECLSDREGHFFTMAKMLRLSIKSAPRSRKPASFSGPFSAKNS